jgi:hypothetical protein
LCWVAFPGSLSHQARWALLLCAFSIKSCSSTAALQIADLGFPLLDWRFTWLLAPTSISLDLWCFASVLALHGCRSWPTTARVYRLSWLLACHVRFARPQVLHLALGHPLLQILARHGVISPAQLRLGCPRRDSHPLPAQLRFAHLHVPGGRGVAYSICKR